MAASTIQERTYQFSLSVIRFLRASETSGAAFQTLSRQLVRCATSVGANVVEAQAGSSKKDFTNFLFHSLKSANESVYWLRLISDAFDVDKTAVKALIQEATELARILGASVAKLRAAQQTEV